MAEDYLFYEEDYEDISDWDEDSDPASTTTTTTTKPTPNTLTSAQEEEKVPSPPLTTSIPTTPTQPSKPSTSKSIPYIAKSTSASFIVHEYSVFTSKEMQHHLHALLTSIATTLNLSPSVVSLLLRRFSWKTERLMEKYLQNSIRCLDDHHIPLTTICPPSTSKTTSSQIECPMCLDDVALSDTLSLTCHHRFCRACWADYANSQIATRSFNAVLMTCPGHKCSVPVPDAVVKSLVDKARWAKYESYLCESFITHNDATYKFCPAPGCHYVIYCTDTAPKALVRDTASAPKSPSTKTVKSPAKTTSPEKSQMKFFGQRGKNKRIGSKRKALLSHKNGKEPIAMQPTMARRCGGDGHSSQSAQSAVLVQCRCGLDLCFLCLEEFHAPATCAQVSAWNAKANKEADNAQWIVSNTKKCPKCLTRIERNRGCNHMVCTKCQYEFCWVCMGSWKEHGIGTGGYYRCNKYKPKAKMGNKQKLAQSEDEELDKFVHYFNRFHNHAQSRQFLMESGHQVLRKIKAHLNAEVKKGNAQGGSWIDVEWMCKAHDEIFFCRQILKYTYVYAYYLKSGKEKELFEFLQQDLEKNCEILHELCEQDWKSMDAAHIINYTNMTHRFVKSLLHGIANGLTR